MRERRQLRLAKMQMTLARIARREAMGALADALEEERKSDDLAQRSTDMAQGYGARRDARSGAQLRALRLMAGGLAEMARDAQRARDDARQQADWQVEALATAENKLQRMEELAGEARRKLARAEAAREASRSGGGAMARKLQTSNSNT
ncbi:MAG: hypothetical protein AAF687_02800 [Pseudomonadota bacterium]